MFSIRSQPKKHPSLETDTDIARDTVQRQQWQLAIVQELTELAMSLARQAASEAAQHPQAAQTQPLEPTPAQPATTQTPPPAQPPAAGARFVHYGNLVLRCVALATKIGEALDRSRNHLRRLLEWHAAHPQQPKPAPQQTRAEAPPPPSPVQPSPTKPRPTQRDDETFPSLLENLSAELGLNLPQSRPRVAAFRDG